MSDFFDVTEEDLAVAEKLIFKDQEIVKMTCIDVHENHTYGSLKLKCKVLTGEHQGKTSTIFLSSNDNEASKKAKNQFLRAFWTMEEIRAKSCKSSRLVGRDFTVKSRVSEKDGKTYQNWQDFQDLGGSQAAPATAAAAPSVNPAGQVSF